MTWPLPTLFPEVLAGVTALDRAGRWQEALAAALDLYRHFPEEPRACAVLVDMLVALDRGDQAHAVLREARQRFPAEAWIAHRLAEQAAARQDWPAALAHWRDAGLPDTADPAVLRQFALAFAHAGEANAALRLVTSSTAPTGSPVQLAEVELLIQLGRMPEAAARWQALPTGWNEPGYAQATCLLGRLPEDDIAAPMLAALLAEPDPGTEAWRPTVALALSADAEVLSRRVQVALAQEPAETSMTHDVAAALTETKSDADALAARIGRAVQDGRSGLLPLLFETAGQPARAANLRVALRLYLNRNFADPATLDALSPASVCALLLLARVIDPDCLRYIAEHVRGTTTRPGLLQLARPQDVLAQIAHTAEPLSLRIRVQRRLRVAICVSGRLPAVSTGVGLTRALRLQAHDAMVFAHVWQRTGAPAEMAELDAVSRRLPPLLGAAMSTAAAAGGMAGLRRLYPGLLQGRPGTDVVDEATVRALFHTDHVTVQDDGIGPLAARAPLWKTRHAAREAHLLAAATGEAFDLCLHMQAGSRLAAAGGIDWHGLAETAQNEAVMFADAGPAFHRVHGFTVGQRFGLGAMTTMGLAADSFVLGEQVASGRVFVHGFPRQEAAAHALAMQTHLNGITVRPLAELTLDVAAELDPLSPAAALTLLWHDIRARRPASPDKSLIRAAMADVEAPSIPI